MSDSQFLMSIYRQYLEITAKLVELLEKHYVKENDNQILKEKRQKFILHAQQAIGDFHNDLHNLFKMAYELKDLEKENDN